ncbi:MAG: hypothetical protein HN855_01910 [Anaerolineae bacterium]|jgi:tetratricopeptide (TPR) repeat protein|nr:hypothetical protein [Anaerolineae bacterium]MBT7070695.1 hypothetical protein [Anaerolineae bacterium]MBT7323893.1 hypothetical protein [Anaerolineae bacterium]
MKKRIIVGIIYLILLSIVIAISLAIFPEWKSSGGFWALFGVAAVAVLSFVEKGISLWNKSEDEEKKDEEKFPEPSPSPTPLQSIGTQNAEQIINAPGGTVNILPPTPKEEPEAPKGWHLKHRYALTGNFTGRETELNTLTDWLETKDEPLIILRALGGFGKSALTWHWLLNKVDRTKWTKAIWWSFYEGDASFQNFLTDTLKYLLGNNVELPSAPRLQIETLLKALEEKGILLVMDGFERALRAYSGMNAAYQEDIEDESPLPSGEGQGEGRRRDCVSPAADDFLRGLASLKGIIQAKVLMTTRLRPRAVEMRGNLLNGCLEKELLALEKDDAVAFFQNQGIKGTRFEMVATCAPYGYHPLTLSILAGYILGNRSKPNDVSVAKELNVTNDIIQNKHHVLEVAYESLSSDEQKLLSTIACLRSATEYKTLLAIFVEQPDNPITQELLDNQLKQLETRGLLHWDKPTNKYDLHPIVRRYAYERLTAPARTAAHTRLKDYFEAVPEKEKIESLNDLAPVIELYHHMVRAGQFDAACDLYYDRMYKPIYFQLGSYQTEIELLVSLFKDISEPPLLSKESDQAWTLNSLANSYSLNGEPRRAVPLFLAGNEPYEKSGNKKGVAIGLGNVATQQLIIGALGDAERNLRRSIDLCRETENEFQEAIGHQELGRVLAYRGLWAEAEQALDEGLRLFEKEQEIQSQGMIWAYRSLRALLMARENPKSKFKILQSAIQSATRALELADEDTKQRYEHPRDYVRAHWLLGASHRENGDLEKAEKHLSESLRRCRAINSVDAEANILLEVSKLRHAQGNPEEVLRLAHEALLITERSGYVLQGADVNIWLATLAMKGLRLQVEGDGLSDRELAREYAQKALQLAHCDDGPPYHYKVAYEEAEALLKELESRE